MRKQAWNYKSQIVPKNNSKGNLCYFKGCDNTNEDYGILLTLWTFSSLTKTLDGIIPTGIAIANYYDENMSTVFDFAIDFDLKIIFDGLFCTIGEYLPISMEESIDFDKLPRLTEEEFYSLA